MKLNERKEVKEGSKITSEIFWTAFTMKKNNDLFHDLCLLML